MAAPLLVVVVAVEEGLPPVPVEAGEFVGAVPLVVMVLPSANFCTGKRSVGESVRK